ncbi:hypothetical protein DQX05_10755 [Paenibacillus thiaminolyticus]|uniref:Uncharacterized protein n=1 Tax=Paenibacillus thiaminolyticus TaxID=49283 RepID=A0A3A3H097_PANTH|nr:hypothetical protein DQX05_10755 [Paenibacillus thiaminolyticus]
MGMNRLQIGKRLWLWVQPMEADIWQGMTGEPLSVDLWHVGHPPLRGGRAAGYLSVGGGPHSSEPAMPEAG